jgi:hypothetical protein
MSLKFSQQVYLMMRKTSNQGYFKIHPLQGLKGLKEVNMEKIDKQFIFLYATWSVHLL